MDLLSLVRTVTRFWYLTVPVVLITLFGCVYVAVGVDPVYEARSSYVLVPPVAISQEQLTPTPRCGV